MGGAAGKRVALPTGAAQSGQSFIDGLQRGSGAARTPLQQGHDLAGQGRLSQSRGLVVGAAPGIEVATLHAHHAIVAARVAQVQQFGQILGIAGVEAHALQPLGARLVQVDLVAAPRRTVGGIGL
jgi:hypothetical protein